jgi:hypothetical protein
MNRISTPGELPPGYRYAYHDDDRQPTVWIVDATGHAVTPVCDGEREAWEWLQSNAYIRIHDGGGG